MNKHLKRLIEKYPDLEPCEQSLERAFRLLHQVFLDNGKLLLCGNGGSCSDAGHIAGELMKSFMSPRPLESAFKHKLRIEDPENGGKMAEKLQRSLPAIPLSGSDALATAIANDIDSELVFAQQVLALGNSNDALMAISTSGNSRNVCRAVTVARALGMKSLGLTGGSGGWLRENCEVCVVVPGRNVPEIQELHLPAYHCLCLMLEEAFFGTPATGSHASVS